MSNKYLEKIAETYHPLDSLGGAVIGAASGIGAAKLAGRKHGFPAAVLGALVGSYAGSKATKKLRRVVHESTADIVQDDF